MTVRRALGLAALACALPFGGCSLGGDDEKPAKKADTSTDRTAPPSREGEPAEAGIIRDWIAANNAGHYLEAAGYFARGAIVEQSVTIRLNTRAAAIAFNRSLPCRAQVTDVDDEGTTVLAAFKLREGRQGGCKDGGSARVRFRFENGKFTEWRQLPGSGIPKGQVA